MTWLIRATILYLRLQQTRMTADKWKNLVTLLQHKGDKYIIGSLRQLICVCISHSKNVSATNKAKWPGVSQKPIIQIGGSHIQHSCFSLIPLAIYLRHDTIIIGHWFQGIWHKGNRNCCSNRYMQLAFRFNNYSLSAILITLTTAAKKDIYVDFCVHETSIRLRCTTPSIWHG